LEWVGKSAKGIIGGFWAPIENAFGIKRHTLRKLAGHNGNRKKNYRSRDFYAIEKTVKKYRERQDREHNYFEIKTLFWKRKTRMKKQSTGLWRK